VHVRRTDFVGSKIQMHSTAPFTLFAIDFLQNLIKENGKNDDRISVIIFGDDKSYSIRMIKFVKRLGISNQTILSIQNAIENNNKTNKDT
jgi:hypothetical protein